jgi:hypothetical protein
MASDTITLLGGDCCRPSAVRSSDSTTTMRTKLVIMMMIEGAMDSTVTSATICSILSVKSPLPFRSMDSPPAGVAAAAGTLAAARCSGAAKAADGASTASSSRKGRMRFIRFTARPRL